MLEVAFLLVLGFLAIIFASVQDIKKREVADWLNYSLIIFALGFRFFYCLFNDSIMGGWWFFYYGLIGLGVFYILGNVLYYCRVFAGGDAKLLIALGTILPISVSFWTNLKVALIFLLIFFICGAFYGLVWSVYLSVKNWNRFRPEIKVQFRKFKNLFYFISIFGLGVMSLGLFIFDLMLYIGILIFILPWAYIAAKAIDESAMIKLIECEKLSEGDWLYKDIKVKGKLIKANWEGLSKSQIKFLVNNCRGKKIYIRQGIPFVPVFLISFVVWGIWVLI
jgi:Flp pilus assembly protein protease CpaA